MRHSIRTRYTMILVAVVAAIIGFIFVMNNFYLENYAVGKRHNKLKEAQDTIATYVEAGGSLEATIAVDRLCSANNLTIWVAYVDERSADPRILYASNVNQQGLGYRLIEYFKGGSIEYQDVYEEGTDYVIYKIFDDRLDSSQLECAGRIEQVVYIISTSMEGIQDSVFLTNQFLAYVGLVGILLGGIAVYFVSRSLTRPILELAALSEQMAQLNFAVRYEGGQKNEIGVLGAGMNRMSDNLHQAIEELRAANVQLEKDIREKERIDEMRREFLSNVSHELKTPIALIQGYGEGLRDGINEDPESMEFYCDVIVDEARKMNLIVKRLLNLDEMESGMMVPAREEFNLAQVLEGLMQASAVLAKDRACQTELEVPDQLMVYADSFMIEEVVQNYLSNAYHYVSDSGVICIKAEQKENGNVRVSVYNTGKQIPEEDIDRIWDKFYKVDKARTRSYGGSGIGLSIVKAILHTHSGLCGACNQTGGVEFWFELPAVPPEQRKSQD